MKRGSFQRLTFSCLILVLAVGLIPPSQTSAAATTPTTSSASSTTTTNANGAFDVTVSPTSQDLQVNPGGSVTTTIQLRNEGSAPEYLKVLTYNLQEKGVDGTPILLPFSANDPSKNWVTYSTNEITAQPDVWTPVTVTFSPPKTAAFSYDYAILFQRSSSTGSAKKVINQVASVASIVLLNVNAPGAVKQASIAQFSTEHKVSEFLPVTFTIRMHNTGNVYIAPRGTIFIMRGKKDIGMVDVNDAQGNILPKSYRVFTTSWADGTPVYKDKLNSAGSPIISTNGSVPETYLDWSNFSTSKLRFGKYNARLDIVYNNGQYDVETVAYLSFWVIPWRIIFFVVLIVLFILAGIWTVIIRPLRKRTSKGRGWSANKN